MKKNPGRKERRRMHRNFVKDFARFKMNRNNNKFKKVPKNA